MRHLGSKYLQYIVFLEPSALVLPSFGYCFIFSASVANLTCAAIFSLEGFCEQHMNESKLIKASIPNTTLRVVNVFKKVSLINVESRITSAKN